MLDTVGNRIADDLEERLVHHAKHMRIEPDPATLRFEGHALPHRPRHVPRRALEKREQ